MKDLPYVTFFNNRREGEGGGDRARARARARERMEFNILSIINSGAA